MLAELIELIKKLLEGYDDSGFSLEMTFLIPLTMVSYMFRHRALRQEAIRLLLSYPRREGLWDGMVIGEYSQWIAEIDEEELGDEEYVPHDLASVLVEVDADKLNRTAKLLAYKKIQKLAKEVDQEGDGGQLVMKGDRTTVYRRQNIT